MLKSFLKDESGITTIEIVVIIAVLVGLALLFKDGITDYINKLMKKVWDVNPNTGGMDYDSNI